MYIHIYTCMYNYIYMYCLICNTVLHYVYYSRLSIVCYAMCAYITLHQTIFYCSREPSRRT